MRTVEQIIDGPARRQARELFHEMFRRRRRERGQSTSTRCVTAAKPSDVEQCTAQSIKGKRCEMYARIGLQTCWLHRDHEPSPVDSEAEDGEDPRGEQDEAPATAVAH